MEDIKHTTIRNGKLFCLHCGGSHDISLPMALDKMVSTMEAFNALHANCVKTWEEPEPDHSLLQHERAQWWMKYGETGLSSKTMWYHFMNCADFAIDYPHDPSDFGRCYKLLEAVPEWKSRIKELASLSPVWKKLVENWDKLSRMYEDLINTKAEKGSEMFDLMQSLIKKNI